MKRLHNLYDIEGFYLGQRYGENTSDAVVQGRLSGILNFKLTNFKGFKQCLNTLSATSRLIES